MTPEGQPDERGQQKEQQDAANANNDSEENQAGHEQEVDVGGIRKR